jgi:hypothetical protein
MRELLCSFVVAKMKHILFFVVLLVGCVDASYFEHPPFFTNEEVAPVRYVPVDPVQQLFSAICNGNTNELARHYLTGNQTMFAEMVKAFRKFKGLAETVAYQHHKRRPLDFLYHDQGILPQDLKFVQRTPLWRDPDSDNVPPVVHKNATKIIAVRRPPQLMCRSLVLMFDKDGNEILPPLHPCP